MPRDPSQRSLSSPKRKARRGIITRLNSRKYRGVPFYRFVSAIQKLSRSELVQAVESSRRDDLVYFLELARHFPGTILELGTGTARVLGALLAAGHDAYGIELDPEIYRQGRVRLGHVARFAQERLLLDDMREFRFKERFSLIIAPGNSLGELLTKDDVCACFRSVAAQLSPEGRFAFQVPNPLGNLWSRPPHRWTAAHYGQEFQSQEVVRREYGCYSPDSGIVDVVHEFAAPSGEFQRLPERWAAHSPD